MILASAVKTTTAEGSCRPADWPEGIPHNYPELERMYGAFIASFLRRHNKVNRNFMELYSYVRMRLIEVDVIGKFMLSVSLKQPATMNTLEVCELFGVTYTQWKTKMWAWHMGDPVRNDAGQIVCRRPGGWMPTPINVQGQFKRGGLYSKSALFDSSDIMHLASMERPSLNGTVRGPFLLQASSLQVPKLEATKKHFMAYLKNAIYSNFLNWCRTYRRHYALDRPMELDDRDDDKGRPSWEQNLVDPSTRNQETLATVREAVQRLSTTLYQAMKNVPTCKPVSELEAAMLNMLASGQALPDVVKKLDVPDSVRRAILLSVAA